MDLNQLFSTDTGKVEIKHPVTGKLIMDESSTPKPMYVTFIGSHTKEYKKIQRKFGYDSLKKKNKEIKDMNLSEYEEAAEALELTGIEVLAKIITDCNLYFNGKKVKCDEKSLLEVFSQPQLYWITDQIAEERADANVFFKS